MIRVIGDTRLPIKIWATDLEVEAEQQLRNMASMPFIHHHVAAMADSHAGKGSTVGTVIATKGAIIPASVGVDIGCFVGETKIPLLNGYQKTLQSLYKETKGKSSFWVYSMSKDLKIVPGKAICVKTRKNANLIKIIVSGGEEIVCTPDHQFMLKDGSYKEAKDLKINDSLMPLYRSWQTRDGYESVSNGKGTGKMTYHLVYEYFEKVKLNHIIHHKDHNHFNNTPENLISMTVNEHSKYHRNNKEKYAYWHSKEFEQKRLEGIKNYVNTEKGYKQKSDVGKKNILKYMQENTEHFKKSTALNGNRGKKFLITYNKSEKGKAKSKEMANKLYPCKECGEKFKGGFRLSNHVKKMHGYNHKVIAIEEVSYKEDVYCLQVEEHNNFALSAGVFVHNCGMTAVKLPFNQSQLPDSLDKLRSSIERSVPVSHHANKEVSDRVARVWHSFLLQGRPTTLDSSAIAKSAYQIGTLGGGNHFIELCLDDQNGIWVMLHSGSRNIGKTLAEVHIGKAKDLMKQYFIDLPDPDLAYLAQETPEFKNYIHDLLWAQRYAKENRNEMMLRVLKDVSHFVYGQDRGAEFMTTFRVDCHHNYTTMENHFDANVWVTRKGAVSAREGEFGIIPGSMGTKSYIVEGMGNLESFCSCSHGAGRRMSRTRARATYNLNDLKAQTYGVECRKDDAVIDEIPEAYKNIEEVMANQADLVKIHYTLKQVLVVKG